VAINIERTRRVHLFPITHAKHEGARYFHHYIRRFVRQPRLDVARRGPGHCRLWTPL